MKQKSEEKKKKGYGAYLWRGLLCAAAVLCIVIQMRRCVQERDENTQRSGGYNVPDVVASRRENHTYDLTVAANCSGIEDYEAFAEEVIQKYEENSFYTTRLSMDFGGKAEEVCFHVYLKREEIGKKEELFQIRYRDGDIILDGIDGKR